MSEIWGVSIAVGSGGEALSSAAAAPIPSSFAAPSSSTSTVGARERCDTRADAGVDARCAGGSRADRDAEFGVDREERAAAAAAGDGGAECDRKRAPERTLRVDEVGVLWADREQRTGVDDSGGVIGLLDGGVAAATAGATTGCDCVCCMVGDASPLGDATACCVE